MARYDDLILRMMEHDRGQPHLIQHFLKVHQFARLIGARENLDAQTLHILETAAIVHDIGILPSMRVYGDDAGAHQELLGPAEAESMLRALDFEESVVRRVSYLVGHHHTYTGIDGMDYRILVEADFLVNLFENHAGAEAAARAEQTVFATKTGKELLRMQFDL